MATSSCAWIWLARMILFVRQAIRAWRRGDLTFGDYRRRILLSPLGQALTVRTGVTELVYRLRWAWFQKFFWRVLRPVVTTGALLLVLNWARRMK